MSKSQEGQIDGTPQKRLFWSIISDYDVITATCELIDNAIDTWKVAGGTNNLLVELDFDHEQQNIRIKDNAGGIKKSNLRLLVSPGGSNNDPNALTIGIFGVGSKRAVVALAESISIKTRFLNDSSYQIDIDQDWLSSPSWDLPYFSIDDVSPGSTIIEMTRLRRPLSREIIRKIEQSIGEIYAHFISTSCSITMNGRAIKAHLFSSWSYPPEHEPRRMSFEVPFKDGARVLATVTAGLISDRIPEVGNYGCYFYCNDRLVAKEIKTRDVGYFVPGEAGVPHPDASLCRAIVEFSGPARLMPWNSSKTGINFDHGAFENTRPAIVKLISHFTSLSRRLKNDWEEAVFSHAEGLIAEMELASPSEVRRVTLPPLPRVTRSTIEQLKENNSQILIDKPWTLGLVEAVSAIDVIERQRWETGNRIAIILLDSSFEIALKEFIVHRTDLFPKRVFTSAKIGELFTNRARVVSTVVERHPIEQSLLDRVSHYYELRNKFIHERATASATRSDVENYRSAIQLILSSLFGLSFS